MDSDNRLQVIDRLKQSTNVLVTVNNNPSVDQLAACIGVTLLLNKLGKHATAVFSGNVPSTLEFLKPEETLEKNTDSLRDFIIALDKSKADKLRYKVEDTMVKIFITPYKTSISDKDLEFSQGDFNVDVVLALGIQEKEQVDQAIMAHGRILHDAVVMSINNQQGNSIGSINWVEDQASSLSEMITSIVDDLQAQSLDEQISTALLTGIVAETERFRNDKTTSVTMSMSSKLMAAGANQQLVATQLEPEPEAEPEPEPEADIEQPVDAQQAEELPEPEPEEKHEQEGELVIDHPEDRPPEPEPEAELPPIDPNEIDIDREGTLRKAADMQSNAEESPPEEDVSNEQQDTSSKPILVEPPTLGGTLTANSRPEDLEPSTDPLSDGAQDKPILSHTGEPAQDTQTLEQIEDKVHQSEAVDQPDASTPANDYPASYFDNSVADTSTVEQPAPLTPLETTESNSVPSSNPGENIGDARDAVQQAIGSAEADGNIPPTPNAASGATTIPLDLGPQGPAVDVPSQQPVAVDPSTVEPQFPPNLVPADNNLPPENTATSVDSPEPAPPVPPPMTPIVPPFNNSSTDTPQ